MNPADRFSIELSDLRTLADMLVGRAHDALSFATDVNGKPAVVVHPSVAGEMHLLCREIARRLDELQALDIAAMEAELAATEQLSAEINEQWAEVEALAKELAPDIHGEPANDLH